MTLNFVGDNADAEVPCKVFVQIQVFQFESKTAFTAKFQVDSRCLTCSGIMGIFWTCGLVLFCDVFSFIQWCLTGGGQDKLPEE